MRKRIWQVFGMVLVYLSLASPAYASFMYLNPVGGNIPTDTGTSIQVRISAKADESISSTSVYLNYAQDKLDVTRVVPGSAFPLSGGLNYGNGTFAMTRSNVNGVTGDVLVATITFKPKVTNDTAWISFVDGSRASRADNSDTLDIELTKSRTGNYNLVDHLTPTTTQGGLPVAGFSNMTYILIGAGLLLSVLGVLGILLL